MATPAFAENILTSISNPQIKQIRSLRKSDYRRTSGFFIIEGHRELILALASGVGIEKIYFCPGFSDKSKQERILSQSKHKGIQLCEVSRNVYEKIAFGNRREGFLALARQPRRTLADLKLKDKPLIVVSEQIEKPGNLGAIVRTADAAGVDAVIVADAVSDIYNPNTVRSSLGALFTTAVVNTQSGEIIPWLKGQNIQIVSAYVHAKADYTSVDFKKASAIILGSEEKGLGAFWRDKSDCQVCIPMAGKADSLNVSAAAAVLLFEAVRQRSV